MVRGIYCDGNGRGELFGTELRRCRESICRELVRVNRSDKERDGVRNPLRRGWSQWAVSNGCEMV